jgi:hypothetical protein
MYNYMYWPDEANSPGCTNPPGVRENICQNVNYQFLCIYYYLLAEGQKPGFYLGFFAALLGCNPNVINVFSHVTSTQKKKK